MSLYFYFLTGSARAASPTPPSLGPIAELKDLAAQLPAPLWGVRQGAVKGIISDLLHFPLEQARGSSCIKLVPALQE